MNNFTAIRPLILGALLMMFTQNIFAEKNYWGNFLNNPNNKNFQILRQYLLDCGETSACESFPQQDYKNIRKFVSLIKNKNWLAIEIWMIAANQSVDFGAAGDEDSIAMMGLAMDSNPKRFLVLIKRYQLLQIYNSIVQIVPLEFSDTPMETEFFLINRRKKLMAIKDPELIELANEAILSINQVLIR